MECVLARSGHSERFADLPAADDIFNMSQDLLQIPRGSIRATVLIETITAAFQMDEIIWELREHSSGLNCGRWDCACRPFVV